MFANGGFVPIHNVVNLTLLNRCQPCAINIHLRMNWGNLMRWDWSALGGIKWFIMNLINGLYSEGLWDAGRKTCNLNAFHLCGLLQICSIDVFDFIYSKFHAYFIPPLQQWIWIWFLIVNYTYFRIIVERRNYVENEND